MLKLTKTGIGLLTKQYRSVLRKCLLLNLGFYCCSILEINATEIVGFHLYNYEYYFNGISYNGDKFNLVDISGLTHTVFLSGYVYDMQQTISMIDNAINNRYTKSEVQNIQSLNYYYTFRVDERVEAIDYTSFFQKDFSTLQEVDLHIKNPTHLGAFTKCDEVCPRPSERFALSLSQEQMFKNNASVDAGTLSICSLQIGSVNEKLSNVFDV